MSYQPTPGFVLPPAGTTPQQQPSYPSYPSGPNQSYGHQQQPPPPAYNHQPFPGPIQQQPGFGPITASGVQWYANTDYQNYLRNATMFHVKQKVEILEILTGFETANKYTVKDQAGNKVFYVVEQTDVCSRLCLPACRPFLLVVKDLRGMDVLRIERKIDCTCCCGLLCPDTVTVSTPSGQVLGSIVEKFSCIYPKLDLKDATEKTCLKVKGPFLPMAFCGQGIVFQVNALNGVSIGAISKEYGGLVREFFTDADSFNMTFPADLDPSMKAVCLGALFCIDFQYFEGSNSANQGGRRLFG